MDRPLTVLIWCPAFAAATLGLRQDLREITREVPPDWEVPA